VTTAASLPSAVRTVVCHTTGVDFDDAHAHEPGQERREDGADLFRRERPAAAGLVAHVRTGSQTTSVFTEFAMKHSACAS
jgi:hypothetical protein